MRITKKTLWKQRSAALMLTAVFLGVGPISVVTSLAQSVTDGEVSLEGILSVIHVDEVDHTKSHYDYFVEDVKTRAMTQLLFKQPPKHPLRSGDRVRVKGRRMNQTMNVTDFAVGETTDTSATTTTSGTVATAATTHHALVMVLNMTGSPTPYDSTTPPYDAATVSQVVTQMFGTSYSVNTVYNESSFSQLNFPGATENVVLLTVPYSDACPYNTIASNANAAAQLAGVNLSLYQHLVYLVPPAKISGCTWLALGQIGNYGSTAVYKSWSTRNDSLAYAHELGHNLGWHHAATDTNNDGTMDVEYGDTSDLMGYCCGKRKINSVHSDQIGWFNSSTMTGKIVTITGPGLYHLSPLGSDPLTTVYPQVLKITPPDNTRTYYLSYRRALGLDASIPSKYTTGVNVHRGLKTDRWSYEIAVLNSDTKTEFTDSANGITVRQLVNDSSQVTLDVAFGACVRRTPTVAISPATQMVSSTGGVITYSTAVMNNDSVGCEDGSFAMSVTGGSLAGIFQTAVLVVPPGGSVSTGLNVQTSTGLADGAYQLSVKAADQRMPAGQHEGVGAAVLQVDTQTPLAPSSLSALLKKVQGQQAVQLTWPQASDSTGGTGVSSYKFYRNNVLLANTTATSFVDETYSTSGSNTYTVFSVDAVGHVSLTGVSTTFTATSGSGPKGRK